MNEKKPIYVTKPYLPPLEEFTPYLEEIWQRRVLTNSGPMHVELERRLCEYLNVDHISLFANATIALVTALQSLRITGEVITTPYSFVATAHSLLWIGARPIFVDIDPCSFNLDPRKIEQAITPETTAIMPVHVYGEPCDVEAIQRIADNYNLRVIYDAAHAFAVRCHCRSLLSHGDLSVLSFHATKVFNTFEGGAIISKDAKSKHYIDQLKNFGFIDEVSVSAPGINGKMSEFGAALGLLQLEHVDDVIEKRRQVAHYYEARLEGIPGITCVPRGAGSNFSYFPILIGPEYGMTRDGLYQHLKENQIFTRRYFYPLLSSFPMYRGLPSARAENLPVATKIADSVLCLPIYPDLDQHDIQRVIDMIRQG